MAEFWAFVLQPQVLSVLALVVVFVIGLWGKRFLNHFRIVFQVWHLTEKMGILAGLKGYEKLALAMDVFKTSLRRVWPGACPGDEGWAVRF